MAQITCTDVVLGYEGRTVTKNINFSVNKGDYLCIVGENGSGKSTLIKALLRLIKPVSGKIKIDEELAASGMGYLPQQTDIQKDFPATVREVVMSGCCAKLCKAFFGRKDKEAALSVMKRLGIDGLSKRSFRDLSGGQQQRVFLARALCAASDILLLDEPVTGLDPAVTEELYSILKRLNREDNMTIVMVSHDIKAALRFATHILHIGDTQLFFGTAAEYEVSEVGQRFINPGGDGCA
ncbi:MAG: metal ABC transporter ATP-binding protein [Clostridia bacterium]|nr:metal ABC transporter ATP-binding protein [Clostridia bacterium]